MSTGKNKYDDLSDSDDHTEDLTESERNQMDASHGSDEIEIENNEAKGINDMDTFSPMDGEVGDESTDYDDLPSDTKKNHNYYDPTLSTGGRKLDKEKINGLHISEAGEAGISFGKDNYVEDEEDSKKHRKDKK